MAGEKIDNFDRILQGATENRMRNDVGSDSVSQVSIEVRCQLSETLKI